MKKTVFKATKRSVHNSLRVGVHIFDADLSLSLKQPGLHGSVNLINEQNEVIHTLQIKPPELEHFSTFIEKLRYSALKDAGIETEVIEVPDEEEEESE